MRIAAAVLALFTSIAAFGDGGDAANYELFLVPVTTDVISGANGLQWTGELALYNGSQFGVTVVGSFADPRFLSPPGPLSVNVPPGKTVKPDLFASGMTVGAFLQVPRGFASVLKKSLRARDLSRNATSWGTDIPIVSTAEAGEHVTLIDIPTDPQYRAMLRVYHWSGESGLPSRVTVYEEASGQQIATFELTSLAPDGALAPAEGELPLFPSYSQLDLLTPAVRAAGSTIRVHIDNMGGNVSPPLPPIWAFVSVTNNETQQVTVMTPR